MCKKYRASSPGGTTLVKSPHKLACCWMPLSLYFFYARPIDWKTALRRNHTLLRPVATYPLGHCSLDLGQKWRKCGFQKWFGCWFLEGKGPWRNMKPLLVGNTTNRSGNACANKPGRFVSMSQRAMKLQTTNLVTHFPHSTRFETNKNIQIMARCLHSKVVKGLLSRWHRCSGSTTILAWKPSGNGGS